MDYRQKCLEEYDEECYICGYDEQVLVHHIDEDRSNNNIDNLVPLCPTCHGLIHQPGNVLAKLKHRATLGSKLGPNILWIDGELFRGVEIKSERHRRVREIVRKFKG